LLLIGPFGCRPAPRRFFAFGQLLDDDMQALAWIIRLAIVLVIVWFAVKNSQTVTLHGLPEQSWQAPLVFVVLVAFVAGVVIGLLAWLPTVVRQRREIGRLRKSSGAVAPVPPASAPAYPADGPSDVHGV
jgi:uncharacterized integral membrane protein